MTAAKVNYDETAAAGAARLDQVRPEWLCLVDRDRLDMKRKSACMLGQVFYDEDDPDENGYEDGCAALGFEPMSFFSLSHREVELGFNVPQSYADTPAQVDARFAELTAAWLRIIDARRHAGGSDG
jgi:hypothetical protein